MAKPEGHLSDVAGRFQRVHGATVAQDVRRHALFHQGGSFPFRRSDMHGKPMRFNSADARVGGLIVAGPRLHRQIVDALVPQDGSQS